MTARALCLMCGRSGDVVGSSLDPGRPLILCRYWEGPDRLPRGHGTTLGTFSQDESDAIQTAKREARLQAAHVRGSHAVKRNRRCVECQAGGGAEAQVSAGV